MTHHALEEQGNIRSTVEIKNFWCYRGRCLLRTIQLNCWKLITGSTQLNALNVQLKFQFLATSLKSDALTKMTFFVQNLLICPPIFYTKHQLGASSLLCNIITQTKNKKHEINETFCNDDRDRRWRRMNEQLNTKPNE